MPASYFKSDDLDVARKVFEQIAASDWFTDDPEMKAQFARYVIEAFRRRIRNDDELFIACRAEARRHYSRA